MDSNISIHYNLINSFIIAILCSCLLYHIREDKSYKNKCLCCLLYLPT